MTEERVLDRVRKLLDKAAATGFAPESEAFLEKAQELMLKYAIDEAQLAGLKERGKPVAKSIVIGKAYSQATINLAFRVAKPLGLQSIVIQGTRTTNHKFEVFGYSEDVEFFELLYTSLLTQAFSDCEREYVTGYGRSWKNTFLFNFGNRVGSRLTANRKQAVQNIEAETGTSTALVLVPREQQLRKEFEERHPDMRSLHIGVSNYDHHGAARGRAAGDRADISGGRNRVGGPKGVIGRG